MHLLIRSVSFERAHISSQPVEEGLGYRPHLDQERKWQAKLQQT